MKKNLINGCCIEGLKKLPKESIDVILTDPPYKYLKNQKLEVDFDETEYFKQVKRVLTNNGFIVLFGRGTSFYRWNYLLSELNFEFKEEVIWDKVQTSSPLLPLNRHHETISIFNKGKGKINNSKIPYIEMKQGDLEGIITDIKRIRTIINNDKSLDIVLRYLEKGVDSFEEKDKKNKHGLINGYFDGENRALTVVKSVINGMREKSIIKENRDHYTSIHPTQKPVRLLERLIHLVLPNKENIFIADTFAGSFSTCVAVENIALTIPETNFTFYGWEIDKEYYVNGVLRVYDI